MEEQGTVGHGGGHMNVNPTEQPSNVVGNNATHVQDSSSLMPSLGSQHATNANQARYHGTDTSASSTSQGLGQLVSVRNEHEGQMSVDLTVQPSNATSLVGNNNYHVQSSSSFLRPLGSQHALNANQVRYHGINTFAPSTSQELEQLTNMQEQGPVGHDGGHTSVNPTVQPSNMMNVVANNATHVRGSSSLMHLFGSQETMNFTQLPNYTEEIEQILECFDGLFQNVSTLSNATPSQGSQHVADTSQRAESDVIYSVLELASSTLPQESNYSMQHPPSVFSSSRSQHDFTNAVQRTGTGEMNSIPASSTLPRPLDDSMQNPPNLQSSSGSQHTFTNANQDHDDRTDTLTNLEHAPHRRTGEDLTGPLAKQMRMTRSASEQSSQSSRSPIVAHSKQVAEPVIQNTQSPLKKPAATEEELSNLLSLDDGALSAIASGPPKRISKRKVDGCQERILNYAVADILKQTVEKSLIRQYTWNGYRRKKVFKDSNAHKLLKRVLEIKGFANASDEDVGKAVRYAIRISSDWNGGRTDRRNEKKGKKRGKNKNPAPTQVENDVPSQSSDHQVASEAEVSSQEISSKENATASSTPVSATDATPESLSEDEDESDLTLSSDDEITDESPSEDESDLTLSSDDEITDGATQAISQLEEAFPLQSSDDRTTHGKFDALVADGNFREAIALLESHPMTELQQMKLIICYYRIEDFEKTLEIIEIVKTLMAQTRSFTADDLCKLAGGFRGVEGISLYACASKLYLFEADPNDRVLGIYKCSGECSRMLQNRRVFDKVGLKIMKDFISGVTRVENADPDVKTDCLAMCLCNTGWCYCVFARDLNYTDELDVKLKMFDEGKGYCKRGIDVMRKHFGSNSSKHCSFRILLENMGNFHRVLGEYSEARTFHQQAIEAYESAEDMDESWIKEMRDNVEVSLSAIEVEAGLIQSSDDRITHAKYDELVKVWKFQEAITLLESHPKTELQQFRLLECYSHEENLEKTLEIIENMKTLMTETRRFTADDLCKLAEKIFARETLYSEEKDEKDLYGEENVHKNVLRISFYVCASKLYLFEADPDDKVRGIKKCFLECYDELHYLHGWTANIGLKVFNEFIDYMTSVEDANPDVKTEVLVWWLSFAGWCHVMLERYNEGKGYYERGIKVMRKHFGSDSSKHKVFGKLLHRMGSINRYLGKYSEATTFYQQGIEAYESAEDVNDGRLRQRSIDKVKESLSETEIAVFLLQSSDDRITHGKCDALVKVGKFREAITLLESHPKTELQQMKLFQCYFREKNFEKLLEIIENMKTLMTQTRRFTVDYVCILAERFRDVERIPWYACASKLYLFEADPDDRVRGIKSCSDGGFTVLTKLSNLRKRFANKVGVKIMKDFIDDVTSVENADPDVKTLMLSQCLYNTCRCCVKLEMYDEAKEYCERGIDVTKKHLGSDSSG